MSTALSAAEHDLRALAGIVSQDREDLPNGEGLPPSLLADLMGQIPCQGVSVERYDASRQVYVFVQGLDDDPAQDDGPLENWVERFWPHYWDCQICSYPARTGDLRSVVKTSDFYSAREWHSSGMYIDCIRPQGIEHHLLLALPDPLEPAGGPGKYLRLTLHRGPGRDFSERDRDVLLLLRPHLHQALLDTQRRHHPVPRLTPRQNDLLRLVAAGHTNNQIARRLGISEGTVRTHLENIYERLGVTSRTAAVTRAFPGQVA